MESARKRSRSERILQFTAYSEYGKGNQTIRDAFYAGFPLFGLLGRSGKQTKPLAWKELHGQALEEAVYTYTREVLLQLEKEDVLPDIVQIGNEIRSGMLFPDGAVPDYQTMAGLIIAGIRGARSVADKERLKVMIHLDQGGRYQFLKDWFDQALEQGLMDFDIIGLSYYPFWHGTFMDLRKRHSG